jgi:hypothetical protein
MNAERFPRISESAPTAPESCRRFQALNRGRAALGRRFAQRFLSP